jgi:hypothetical protein
MTEFSSLTRIDPPREQRPETLRAWVKQWLPSSLLSSVGLTKRALRLQMYRPTHLRAWLRDQGGPQSLKQSILDNRLLYQRALLDWLKRAQDAAPDGGVAAYYSFAEGWSAAYPETTGYIITTCLEAARRLNDPTWAERARRMADWEVSVQLPDGAWQSGVVTAPPIPAVFNTGQVIQGLLSAVDVFGTKEHLEAAVRGGLWLRKHQDEDGAWRQHTYNNFPNTYSTRVAWPLVALANVTGEMAFRQTALRYLEWVARYQQQDGWFEHCHLELAEAPLTHTLAYTIEGLIECGVLLGDERWIKRGQQAADALLHRYEVRRSLAGRYDRGWRGDYRFTCLTGCVQMGRVWGRLFELTRDGRYINAALKINDYVVGLIDRESRNPGIRGGVKGSHPLWGAYMTYRFPSWAAKFALDSLFQEDDAFALFSGVANDRCHSVRLAQ